MNNKFIKRVAAVVLGVAVLSTCAFAAPSISGESYTSTLNFSIASSADKVSYIAYASEDGVAAGNIVAIGQIDNNVSGDSFSIPVSADLLGSAKYIIIKSGDTSGVAATPKVVSLPVSDYVAAVVCTEATGVYGDICHAPQYKISVEFNKAGALVLNSLTAKTAGYADHALTKIDTLKALTDTAFAKDAELEVNFVLAGAPEAQVAAGIELVPDFTFTAAE